ncbi:hypothetical protein TrCOL_g13710 [Triparma columacea]|uniref:Uncharacterized protein n=1 Tax=Triparma columacea TaxID=722753 RepID=A0A9W7GGZ3_9STRA|nr:hypothetical protein TrCOL_g13710 [Triparma columacea]
MNNGLSFTIGWGVFFFGTMGGAYMGYRQNQDHRVVLAAENVKIKEDQRRRLEILGSKMRADQLAKKAAAKVKSNELEEVVNKTGGGGVT